MTPHLSVVIPVSRPRYKDLIHSLQKHSDTRVEIIAVGNVSDGEMHSMKFLSLPGAGANQARQRGVEESRGESILFLDDDCVIDSPSFWEDWISLTQEFPEICIFGGRYRQSQGSSLDQAYNAIVDLWQEAGNPVGGHMLVRREVFDTVAFDTSIRYGGTESEFAARAQKAGFQFRLVDISVLHEPRLSWSSFVRKAYRQGHAKRDLELAVPLSRQFETSLRTPPHPRHWPYIAVFTASSLLGQFHALAQPSKTCEGKASHR